MKIDNSFTIGAPVEQAWELLTDIPSIAPCLPGTRLSDENSGVYSGSVKIRVGPVTAEYRGSATFVDRDDENYRVVIDGKGRDSRGAGNVQALISAAMTPHEGGQTLVELRTELKVTGRVAQFGRGVMQDVSEKLLAQFVDCLATKLETVDGDALVRGATDGSPNEGEPSARDVTTSSGRAGNVAVGDDDDALDLVNVAGGAVAKRLVPLVAVAVVVVVGLFIVLG